MTPTTRSRASRLRPLLAGILALAAAMGIGRFAYTPILPAMLEAGGLGPAEAGLLASANYAGYLAGALAAALAVPPGARVRAVRVAAITVVATTALMAVTTGLAAWSVVRFVAGLGSAGVFVLASGLVLDDLRTQGRTSSSGWLFTGVGLGIAASGIVVGATGSAVGWRGDWLLLALLAGVAFAPTWGWLPASKATASTTDAASWVPATGRSPALWLLFAAYFLEGVGYIVTGTFLVAIVERMPGLGGLGANVWVVVGLAVIPSSIFWTGVAGRVGYARTLAVAYALQAAGIVLPLVGGVGAAVAAAMLFGGTFAGITALTLALAGHLAPGRSAGLIGLLTAAFGIGQVIGPLVAGIVADRSRGFEPALIGASVVVLSSGALMAALHPFDPLRLR